MLKKYWIHLLVLLLLAGMWYARWWSKSGQTLIDEPSIDTVASTPWESDVVSSVLVVDATPVNDLRRKVSITKNGTLASASSLTINAQAAGRVQTIWIKEGDIVAKGRQLISLADTVNNYYLNTQRAKVWLDSARLQYEQGVLQLDKAVQDTDLALRQAQSTYDTLQQQAWQQLKQAQLQVTTIDTNADNAITTLQSQLFAFKSSMQNQNNTIRDLVDKTIGESIVYVSQGNAYESSLIAWSRDRYRQAESDYDRLEKLEQTINSVDTTLTGVALMGVVDQMVAITQEYNTILLNLQWLYQAAILSVGFNAQIQGQYLGQVQQLIGQVQASLSQLTNYKDQLQKLITPNTDGQTTTDISKEQAELQYAVTKTQLDDSITKTKIALDQAKQARDFALNNRNIQKKLLQNAINNAKVNYNDAAKNSGKLSVTAPIAGSVAEILVDKWQDVWPGTPLVRFIGKTENEIRITVDASQRQWLSVGDDVSIRYGAVDYGGRITSISSVADGTLGYPVTISTPDEMTTVGGTVQVTIPLDATYPLVPLSAITPRGRDRAMVALWNGSEVVMQEVQTHTTRGDMVEVDLSELASDYSIIISDLTNYDPSKQTIEIKKD